MISLTDHHPHLPTSRLEPIKILLPLEREVFLPKIAWCLDWLRRDDPPQLMMAFGLTYLASNLRVKFVCFHRWITETNSSSCRVYRSISWVECLWRRCLNGGRGYFPIPPPPPQTRLVVNPLLFHVFRCFLKCYYKSVDRLSWSIHHHSVQSRLHMEMKEKVAAEQRKNISSNWTFKLFLVVLQVRWECSVLIPDRDTIDQCCWSLMISPGMSHLQYWSSE